MKFHEAFARQLRAHDIETIFGLMGDANLYVVTSFTKAGGRFVGVAHESTSVMAANGHAQATGEVGVATVTHGPALTNCITALVEAARERTPLVLIAGDTSVVDRDNFQNISQRDVVLPTGAGFEQVRSIDSLAEDLDMAFHRARTERRPIVLNVPVDFQWQDVEETPVKVRAPYVPAASPDVERLDAALGILAGARRPVILAGRGAYGAAAKEAILALAETLGAPVATTLRARDLFRGVPANMGVFGTLSHEIASEVIAGADVVLAFGASLNKWTTMDGDLLRGKASIQVDADPAALQRFGPTTVPLLGDSAAVASAMLEALLVAEIPSTKYADEELLKRLAVPTSESFDEQIGTVDLRAAVGLIDELFPADRRLVCDGGRWIFSTFTRVHVPHPSCYHHTINFGSIGLGLGAALGAAALGDRPTLLLTGDGGFMMGGLNELNTAVRHGLDLTVVVFNDRCYGAEYRQLVAKGQDPAPSLIDWPPLAPVAEALGAKAFRATSLAELRVALDQVGVTQGRGVALIEVLLDPARVPR